MAEGARYIALDGLEPADALQILAEAARRSGADARGLTAIRIGVNVLLGITNVTLVVPGAGYRGRDRAIQHAAEELLRTYADHTGSMIPQAAYAPTSGDFNFRDGVILLLCVPSGRPAEPEPSECLLVAEGVGPRRAAQIFEDARFDPTNVRTLAALDDSGGQRQPGESGAPNGVPVYYFHIRDDRHRRSTFQAAVTGERFFDCVALDCFDAGNEARVFLPPNSQPGRPSLEAFRALVELVPGLGMVSPGEPLPAGTRPDRVKRLLAVYPRRAPGAGPGSTRPPGDPDHIPSNGTAPAGVSQPYAVVFLAGFRFLDQIDLQARRPSATYQVVDLRATEAVAANLRETIERSGTGIGYRLELRRSAYVEARDEQELYRLHQAIFDLELQRAALESISPLKPTLFRFSQEQLAGLADVLRAYPPRVLQDGALQYAFQPAVGSRGTERVQGEHSGLHFLLADPRTAGVMIEKLRFPEMTLSGPTMHFWLDPYWARYYEDGSGECLVFVPYGTALFPSMHDWDTREMQEYLRFAVRRWFSGTEPATGMPERAVYIFDGDPDPQATIHVTVLDRDKFCPLRQRIGWINTNLEAMRPDDDVADIIHGIADARTRTAVLRAIVERAGEVTATFDTVVRAANDHVSARIQELLDALTEEMTDLIGRAQRTTDEIGALKTRLRDLDETRLDMRRISSEVGDAATQTGKAADDLGRFFTAELAKARQRVASADAERAQADKDIETEVSKLLETRRRLERVLERLW